MGHVSASSAPARVSMSGRLWRGVSAICLAVGGLVGLAATTASASTTAVTLTMSSGTFGVHGNTPGALPTPATFSGHVNTTSGAVSAGTLTVPSWSEHNTGSTETIHIFDAHAGTATGSVDYHGNVTVDDTVTMQVHITSPINETCTSTPVNLILQSTSPYSTTTKNVTLSDTTFTIPNFSTSTCSLAASSLDSQFSGSSGNVFTLNLHGTLPLPPAPTTATATSLLASPAGPQLQGSSVTLTAAVTAGGTPATGATGTIDFYSGTTLLSAKPVVSGGASFSTTALPPGTGSLSAVYSGDGTYAGSTSSAVNYVIQPKPTVSLSLPTSVIAGAGSPTTFSLTLTNPATGENWSSLWLAMKFSGISGQSHSNVSLSYENPTHVWCPMALAGFGTISTTFKGTAGSCSSATAFSLSAGHSLTLPLEVSFSASANYGPQKLTATLETVSGGVVVAPLSGAAAPVGSGTIQVDPATPLPVTVSMTLPTTATAQGYVLLPKGKITKPANTTTTTIFYPTPTGTATYLVDGHAFTPPQTSGVAPAVLTAEQLPTAGLSVGSHTLKITYSGDGVYAAAHATGTFSVSTAAPGTSFTCSSAAHPTITASVVASGTVPATTYSGSATATGISVTLHIDPTNGPTTTAALTTVTIGLSPNGGTTASSVTPTKTGGITSASWSGLSATVTGITGTVGTEVPIGIETINFIQSAKTYTCSPTTSPAHIGTVEVVAPPTPVTWSVIGCTTGTTTAPIWANTEKIVANGAGGGGGGAAASAGGYGGAGGAGGKVTTYLTIAGSTTVSAKTGCAGKGAPQGSGVVGNGGAAVSGWSSSGKGGQGRYTAIFTSGNDGTGGSGGGSTGVCNGTSTCTSATTTHVVAVAAGGGGGGESMCSGTNAGSGGQAGNAGTTATSSSKGKGWSGSGGAAGGTSGVAGGAGGANNKSSGSGVATGSAGGQGKKPFAGDGGGSGGGGAGYVGGAGGAPTAADCGAGGGGGGGASWVATAGNTTSFGTGASGGSRSGTTGSAGSVTVTFSYTP